MPTKKAAVKSAKVEPFIISRTFDAPRALVVRAWTEREHLMHWWGPKGVTVLPGRLELKKGGIFHYALQLPDGNVMWGKWVIREVALPDRLVWVNNFSDENSIGRFAFQVLEAFPPGRDVFANPFLLDQQMRNVVKEIFDRTLECHHKSVLVEMGIMPNKRRD